MKVFYTFGTDERFPFCGGWVEVEAPSLKEAHAAFQKEFPDREPGILNCSDYYTKERFMATGMAKSGNRGAYCHKKIDVGRDGFFGKECNYAFPCGKGGSHVFILGDGREEYAADFDDIDSCILWAAFQEFIKKNTDIEHKNAVIRSSDGKTMIWIDSRDRLLEYAWQTLTDVNIDEDEKTEQNWFIFPAGTDKEEIWHWFDERYSKGVAGLLYGDEEPPEVVVPWTSHREEPLPWVFIRENGKDDEAVVKRLEESILLVMDAEPFLYEGDVAVLFAPSANWQGMEEVVAVVVGWTDGYYLLYAYDSEELFDDNTGKYIQADNLKEAVQIAHAMINDAICEKKERLDAIQKRYTRG